MSDEPSDAQKLIVGVLRDHRWKGRSLAPTRCTCGVTIRDLEAHRAAEVDKALGGLKREIRGRRGVTTHVRFASGWTVTE